jgi:hypothetical protein
VIVNHSEPPKEKHEAPIRKHNQVAVMIHISDDETRKEEALKFVLRLN